jgi:hypothetical protein
MAEVKNVFIKSKMNKDLDDRLLPSGEYRDAMNIAVSKSESSDVGALENIVGNKSVIDFYNFLGVDKLICIGYFRSEDTNTIFFFLTDNLKTTNTQGVYVPTANNFVVSYNVLEGTTQTPASPVIRLKGAYLNFYEGNPIYGVNLIENLLFWTDNRNQPRRIDVSKPSSYYTSEDQISVASYNPYQPIDVWQESALAPGFYETTMKDVVDEFFPGGGQLTPNATNTATDFTCVRAGIQGTPKVGDRLTSDVAGFTEANITAITFPQLPSTNYTFTTNVNQTYSIGAEYKFGANPYYEQNFQGDPDYLTDIFARFSYRFQFEDNTYSIMAPYTQECFIPKQDGYFLAQRSFDDPPVVLSEDMENAYRSTVVQFMENKVNQIGLRIQLPYIGDDLIKALKLQNIQILYKESDAQAIQVVDTIPASTVAAVAGSTNMFEYMYNSTKPFQTLPGDEVVRVYDKVPVKAFGQEIISNRIVYSNFQTKHSPPDSIDYNVNVTPKSSFSIDDASTPDQTPVQYTTSIIEYPNHSLKQNRNYQVGFVLSDRYGRTSTTILSNDGSDSVSSLSTIFNPYRNPSPPQQDESASVWPGDSLKVNVNNVIPVEPVLDDTNFYPGVYNGDPTSDDYNPLGWYSYKIVVKQNEQDYYNVYLPGILNGYPGQSTATPPPDIIPFPTGEEGYTANIVLINDNINKIPRDLNEVGPEQRQFRSSVRLFGRVTNKAGSGSGIIIVGDQNQQYYPGRNSDTVVNIGTTTDSNMVFDTLSAQGQENLYQIDTQPYIARLSTFSTIGQVTNSMTPFLAVYETEPTVSRIDIYYETTTAGLIQDLNYVVENNTSIASGLQGFNFLLREDAVLYNGEITGAPFTDNNGNVIPSNLFPGLQGLGNVFDRPQVQPANTVARFEKATFQGDGTKLVGTTAIGANGTTAIVSEVIEQPNYWRVTIIGGGTFPNPTTEIKFAGISKLNINGNFWPIDAGGTALEYSRIGLDANNQQLFSVTDNNNLDVTDHFQIIRVAKGDAMLDGSATSYPQDTYYLATKDKYFLHDGFNSPANNFSFQFSLQQTNQAGQPVDQNGDPTTPTVFNISNNQLLNVTPVIKNCEGQYNFAFQQGQGPTGPSTPTGANLPMVDFIGDNGSNVNNLTLLQNGNLMYEDALTWTIQSLGGPGFTSPCSNSSACGPFSISNYQDPATGKRYGRLIQDGTAIGSYTMTIRCSDSGGLFTDCSSQYIFGETPLVGSFLGQSIGGFGKGVGQAMTMLFINNQQAWNAQGQSGAQGFTQIPPIQNQTAPSSPPYGSSTSTETAANCAQQVVPASGTSAKYRNEVRWIAPPAGQGYTNKQGIQEGTAYVAISMIGSNADTDCSSSSTGGNTGGNLGGGTNSGISSGNSTVKYVFGGFNIDYRLNNTQAWTPAIDLNGDICGGTTLANQSKGTWRHDNSPSNFQYGQLSIDNQYPQPFGSGVSGNWLVRIIGQSQSGATSYDCVASRVFAFDTPGEYRIITDNLFTNNWDCNNTICSGAFETGGGSSSGTGVSNFGQDRFNIDYGDFYYDFGSNRAFSYKVSSSSSPFGGQQLYAKEPLFRYVSQFYTDAELLTKATLSSGTNTYYVTTFNYNGTNWSAAGNWVSQQPGWPNWAFEYSQTSTQNSQGNRSDQELRQWKMDVDSTGAVVLGSQIPLT